MIRFIITLLITAIAIIGGGLLAVHYSWIDNLPSFFYPTLFFLVFSTTVIYAYLFKLGKPEFFVQLCLLTMVVKLLAYGVYTYFMISKDSPGAFYNVVFFMLTYFLFTLLEITFLYPKISSQHTGKHTPKNF